MVVKKTLSNITRGADLLKPKPDLQYVVAAVVGVVVLMIVYKGAQMGFDKFAMMGQSYNPYAPKPDYKAALGII
jgi:hypothetical protein